MTNKKKPMVFGYVRVSTESQLENYSVDEQTTRIQAYCKAKGWTLLKTYTDGGYSGGNTDRPALQQLLSAVQNTDIDAVVVYKLDRLSRSQKDTLTLIEDSFLANKTDFVSINENFDTSSPFGRAMIGILSVFAQLEKDQIVERFTMGRIGRSKAGYFHGGGNIPFGYHYIDSLLEVNEYEAEQVREIYQRFLGGESINSISHKMSAKYPGFWSAPKVGSIIKNSLYIGKVKFSGKEYSGKHKPIVTKADFDAANALLTSSDRTSKLTTSQKTPFRAETLLSGLVYCARCGARYGGNHGKYKCYSRSKSSKKYIIDPHCKNDHWVLHELDDFVIHAIRALLANHDTMQDIMDQISQDKPITTDHKAIEKRLLEIDAQTEKLVDLYQISAIPMETLTARINDMNVEATALRSRLGDAHKGAKDAIDAFRCALERFDAEFESSPLEAQRLMVGMLVKKILLNGKDIKLEWRI